MEFQKFGETDTIIEKYQDISSEEDEAFIERRFHDKTNGKKIWIVRDVVRDAWLDFEKHGLTTQDIESRNDTHPLYQLYLDVREHIKYHFRTRPRPSQKYIGSNT